MYCGKSTINIRIYIRILYIEYMHTSTGIIIHIEMDKIQFVSFKRKWPFIKLASYSRSLSTLGQRGRALYSTHRSHFVLRSKNHFSSVFVCVHGTSKVFWFQKQHNA